MLRFGYRFGTADQVELLPYTLFLNNLQLYPHDFFIRGLHAAIPNERTVMAHLLLPFFNHLEFFCFLFQMLSTVVLVMGLEKLVARFINNRYLAWLSVLVSLVMLNDFSLGNVEVYSECLQASGVACAIVVWAIHFFLNRKYLLVSCLMAMATFIQVLDGLDVMMVMSVVALFSFLKKQLSGKELLQLLLPYSVVAGAWLLLILQAKSGDSPLAPKEVFRILFEFRHPHHFIFATFSKAKIVLYFSLTAVALLYFYNKAAPLFQFILLSTIGLVFYIIATDVFHWEFVANFQFYKVTQWVKLLGVVAGVGYLANRFPKTSLPALFENSLLVMGFAFCFSVIFFFSEHLPYSVPYQIGSLKQADDRISIAEEIKQLTPANAVFIQTFENTELKFYAQRSSYVEFKANVRHKAFVGEWYRRVNEVYGVDYKRSTKGFELEKQANNYFENLSRQQLEHLKLEGVTHVLTTKLHPPSIGKLVTANSTYAVYQL